MTEKDKDRFVVLLKETMKLSLPYCKDKDSKLEKSMIKINNNAYELFVLIEKFWPEIGSSDIKDKFKN